MPVENFNKKPNNAEKRSEKGQTVCLNTRKMPNFVVLPFLRHKETSKLQESIIRTFR